MARRLFIVLGGLVALAALAVLGASLDVLRYAAMSDDGPADAAIVLGAAVRTTGPSPVYVERINHAVELYRSGKVKYLIMTGGKGLGERVAEAEAGRAQAIAAGVPAAAILTETQSRDTQENLANAKPIVAAHGLGHVLVVSDPLHMARAMQMARAAGLDASPSPTPTTRYRTLVSQIPMLIRETYFNLHYRILGS
ncbi:MAG: YdcF family protein [Devosia sp.]|nr:YdcF family protein [Devosia sp.]